MMIQTMKKEWKFCVSMIVVLFSVLSISSALHSISDSIREQTDWIAAMTDDTTPMGIASEKLDKLLDIMLEHRAARQDMLIPTAPQEDRVENL